MQVLYSHCCGLDVHKKSVTACLITPNAQGQFEKQIRTFGTTTEQLLELVDWLVQSHCTIAVMESTGSYWKPVYNLLEGALETWVVNAQHVKAVPGRKTDVKDAEWLAELLQYGLVRPSYIPSQAQRELRELVRYRKSLVQERAAEVNRIQKVLEGGNIKLASVARDIMGVSGARCWMPLWLDKPIRKRWQNWQKGGCERSSHNCSKRSVDASNRISASC
jgi:hypothetical protein